MRFFEPSGAFLDWLADYAGKRIVFDVGSGEGHIVRALRDRQVKAIGIEPRWLIDEELYDHSLCNAILPQMAQECPLLLRATSALVLFCRPCHSGFVGETLDLLDASNEVLYISRTADYLGLDFDLSKYRAKVMCHPGIEGGLWKLTRRPSAKRKRRLSAIST